MTVTHFPTGMRAAVDPDDFLPVWHPVPWRHHTSAPTRSATITSPPCKAGSKRVRRSSSVKSAVVPIGSTITRPCSTESLTSWSAWSLASLAMVAGNLTPRLFPHFLMMRQVAINYSFSYLMFRP
uniref:Uncharacterized protein n=1 Tax=mine drainage metagenome TaxID=410659 RepID=E6QLU1_9ZZZZ